MAETTQFVSRISVKDLISAFESKSETVKVEFSRPRAKSFGNVLNKNVIVRLNEFTTLEDIENALTKLETNLNFYEVYNKAKHVAFQEQFFNILTSIANIENEDEDTPIRKKRLISRTQMLVSFLNQKLPSNINQVIDSNKTNHNQSFKYITYSSYITNGKNDTIGTKTEETSNDTVKTNNDTIVKPTLYVEGNNNTDMHKSGEEYFVSVKKLKENFLQRSESKVEELPRKEVISKVVQKNNSLNTKTQNPELSKPETKRSEEELVKQRREEKIEIVSVSKLRNLFEQKAEEKKGLEIITVEKPLVQNSVEGSIQNVNIPSTERNLGNLRLHRSVSGNYMNYTGLLNRVDIIKSNSAINLNSYDDDHHDEYVSDEESDTGSDDTVKSLNEVGKTEENEKNVSNLAPENNNYLLQSNLVNGEDSEENKSYDSITSITFKNTANENNSENQTVSHLQGYKEEDVQYSQTNTVENLKEDKDENNVTLKGFEEVEVNYDEAKSDDLKEVEAIKNGESKLTFRGTQEVEVNSGIAESETVQTGDNILNNVPQSVSTTPILDLDEDERERSLIDEEIEKIDIDKTLENADFVVNPEDLKNADDEFEKLLENSEKPKQLL